ncbi:MAG: Rossmann-like and DUF2520 domain-containing protein [Burkholderiales bacterium]
MAQTLAIVGAGRVGRALGRRLGELGWRIGAVITRSEATARAAVRAMRRGQAHGALTRQVLTADLVLVATPDRELRGVALGLAQIGGEEWRGKVVLHTSGAMDSSVLDPLAKLGASVGSLHPLQTFSGKSVPPVEGVIFSVEGSRRALRSARQIVRTLGGAAVKLESRHKPAYHAAGAFAAGHTLALMEAAARILLSIGFNRRQASQGLLSLVRQMLDNFERFGPSVAWTGPLSRGDYETVALHTSALSEFPPEYQQAYEALSRLAAVVLAREPEQMMRELDAIFAGARAARACGGTEKQ